MGVFTDLTGQKFGHMRVTGMAGRNKHGQITWNALCECGSERTPSSGDLKSGKIKSCGCKRADLCREGRIQDITGNRYGRLLVVSLNSVRSRKYYYNCQCDCGGDSVVAALHLRRGLIQSCGCIRKEMLAAQRIEDITGRRFGLLVAERDVGASPGGRVWLCRCDCGKTKEAVATKLLQGIQVSCGCAVTRWHGMGPLSSQKIRDLAAAHGNTRRARKRNAGGSFTPGQIDELYKKQRGCCAGPNCGVKLGKRFHRDHIVALANGGTNDILNIQLLCRRCNLKKHAKDPIAWAQENGRLL